jgi:Flp pilus assembly protein TadG
MIILLGIVSYASWFFIAHSVQQAANDAARAGVAGLTAIERATLVQGAANLDVSRTSLLDPTKATVAVQDDGASLYVTISYDASASGLLKMPIVPMPPLQIVRTASVRLDTF